MLDENVVFEDFLLDAARHVVVLALNGFVAASSLGQAILAIPLVVPSAIDGGIAICVVGEAWLWLAREQLVEGVGGVGGCGSFREGHVPLRIKQPWRGGPPVADGVISELDRPESFRQSLADNLAGQFRCLAVGEGGDMLRGGYGDPGLLDAGKALQGIVLAVELGNQRFTPLVFETGDQIVVGLEILADQNPVRAGNRSHRPGLLIIAEGELVGSTLCRGQAAIAVIGEIGLVIVGGYRDRRHEAERIVGPGDGTIGQARQGFRRQLIQPVVGECPRPLSIGDRQKPTEPVVSEVQIGGPDIRVIDLGKVAEIVVLIGRRGVVLQRPFFQAAEWSVFIAKTTAQGVLAFQQYAGADIVFPGGGIAAADPAGPGGAVLSPEGPERRVFLRALEDVVFDFDRDGGGTPNPEFPGQVIILVAGRSAHRIGDAGNLAGIRIVGI